MKPEFTINEIKALSWKQPFASLMLYNKVETRAWNTNYRGWVLICATKSPYDFETWKRIAGDCFNQIIDIKNVDRNFAINGHAIAIGRIVDSRFLKKDDLSFTGFKPNLFGHVYTEVKKIKPFPVKGSQGWFKVTEEMFNQIEIL